jgi:hypothetical protein
VEDAECLLSDPPFLLLGGISVNREADLGFVDNASSIDEADIKFLCEFMFDSHSSGLVLEGG